MSDEVSPLPEFSQLLRLARPASVTLDHHPDGGAMVAEQRQALIDLIGFVREYDGVLLEQLGKPR